MRAQDAVDRVNEAINHLSERLPFEDIMAPAFVSAYGGGGGITISIPVFGGCDHFEIHSEEIWMNNIVELTRLVKQRLLTVLDNIRSSVYEADSAAEPRIFSGMSFEEIQTVADTMLNQDEHINGLVILIANLAARMKEKE